MGESEARVRDHQAGEGGQAGGSLEESCSLAVGEAELTGEEVCQTEQLQGVGGLVSPHYVGHLGQSLLIGDLQTGFSTAEVVDCGDKSCYASSLMP